MNAKKAKSNWGGARPGAGRKPKYREASTAAYYLPADVLEWIDAQRGEMSASEFVASVLGCVQLEAWGQWEKRAVASGLTLSEWIRRRCDG